MTVGCDSVTVVDISRGTKSSKSLTSLFSLILLCLGKGCLIKVLPFFPATSYPNFKIGAEFVSWALPTKWIEETLSLSNGFHLFLSWFYLFKALIYLFLNSAFLSMLGKQYNLNSSIQWMQSSRLQLLSRSLYSWQISCFYFFSL